MKISVFLFFLLFSFSAFSRIDLHPDDSLNLGFEFSRVSQCLKEAKKIMNENSPLFSALKRFVLEEDTTYQFLRKQFPQDKDFFKGSKSKFISKKRIPRDVFTRFEGGWQGKWGEIEARHIWFSTSWDKQFVMISDDGVLQPALNYVDKKGIICGIVHTKGQDRLHEGRFFPATKKNKAYLKWMIPGQNFYETILEPGKYRIDQSLLRDKPEWGVRTIYQSWKTKLKSEIPK